MENASKALLMAGGILIGVLILTLIATLFVGSKDVSTEYEKRRKAELIQQFNVNFTQYLGHDLSIHQVITMQRYALKDNNKVYGVTVVNAINTNSALENDANTLKSKREEYSNRNVKLEIVYNIDKIEYDENTGYVSKITMEKTRRLKITEYNAIGIIENIECEEL